MLSSGAQVRRDGDTEYVFVMNFNEESVTVDVGAADSTDLLTGQAVSGQLELPTYGVAVLRR